MTKIITLFTLLSLVSLSALDKTREDVLKIVVQNFDEDIANISKNKSDTSLLRMSVFLENYKKDLIDAVESGSIKKDSTVERRLIYYNDAMENGKRNNNKFNEEMNRDMLNLLRWLVGNSSEKKAPKVVRLR